MISAQPHKTVQEKLIDQLMKSTNDQVSSEREGKMTQPRLISSEICLSIASGKA